ncbi:MAG: multidrug ABC transporter substrate-binding protein [Candidatus Magasanikbacteria bacterium CG_4_10_14_0_8_um_filter_32_14]|uniref:Multidrug ABC transporter substrate-binding protein n=1 Tax=Candidatus Magasanikbacteria bacterium CG_4_10_14_0_8_um_filter_32_14 TaxID=1974640 RepID=A0A2M7R9U4_9BACT|nr:MAG: multidrug ABC transporter substrate-binding protein [Candidatus Magasanikbacteria bacterium CG_4_10_14_0_8_um_filter_32_14]
MDVIENITSSWQTIAHSKARSFLTMLGIVIGVMAVIIVLSVGAGAQSLIINQVKSLGSNLIGVLPGNSEKDGPPASALGIVVTTLIYDDGKEILKNGCKCIENVAMYVTGNDTIIAGDNSITSNYTGTTASYIVVEDTDVEFGHFFTEEEEKTAGRFVVLGFGVKDKLFGNENALEKRIRIGKVNFFVVGVMKERGVSGFQNQDDQIFIPISSAQKLLLGIDYVNYMRIKVNTAENVDQAVESVEQILRDRHNIGTGESDDFSVRSAAQGLDAISNITNALKFFLVAIASLSLIVGGFGIMNIMLATVQERTQEIGLRKAIGAKSRQIIFQFLVESMVITFLGGAIGIIFGVLISVVVAKTAQNMGYSWDLVITFGSILLACGVSVGIGLLFGIIPARRASKLNAIESLRYE